jgi:hypothetical protein
LPDFWLGTGDRFAESTRLLADRTVVLLLAAARLGTIAQNGGASIIGPAIDAHAVS